MDKNVLEQLLSSYNWWMGLSTIAVAIGILGEYVAHFIFEEEARRNRLQMIVSVLFGVLVLGGVVGEYLFGKKLSQVSEQLQQVADAEVAQFNREAAQARRDAETAKGDAAKANERAAKNETESAQLRKEAEAEHLGRL
jgi:outer membrane murein-binding lipoprotein Lpp